MGSSHESGHGGLRHERGYGGSYPSETQSSRSSDTMHMPRDGEEGYPLSGDDAYRGYAVSVLVRAMRGRILHSIEMSTAKVREAADRVRASKVPLTTGNETADSAATVGMLSSRHIDKNKMRGSIRSFCKLFVFIVGHAEDLYLETFIHQTLGSTEAGLDTPDSYLDGDEVDFCGVGTNQQQKNMQMLKKRIKSTFGNLMLVWLHEWKNLYKEQHGYRLIHQYKRLDALKFLKSMVGHVQLFVDDWQHYAMQFRSTLVQQQARALRGREGSILDN
jgi:hypothetical protein